MMAKPKSDFLLDLATGDCLGSFKGIDPIPEEDGLVNVKYIPINTLFKVEIIKAIPEHAIKRIMSNKRTFTVILENSKGESPFLDKLLGMRAESINELREKLSEKELESRTAQYKAKESKDTLDKQKQRERERSRSSGGGGLYPGQRRLFGSTVQRQQPRVVDDDSLEDI